MSLPYVFHADPDSTPIELYEQATWLFFAALASGDIKAARKYAKMRVEYSLQIHMEGTCAK